MFVKSAHYEHLHNCGSLLSCGALLTGDIKALNPVILGAAATSELKLQGKRLVSAGK